MRQQAGPGRGEENNSSSPSLDAHWHLLHWLWDLSLQVPRTGVGRKKGEYTASMPLSDLVAFCYPYFPRTGYETNMQPIFKAVAGVPKGPLVSSGSGTGTIIGYLAKHPIPDVCISTCLFHALILWLAGIY